MSLGDTDITILPGATFRLAGTYTLADGTPGNFTGATAELQIRLRAGVASDPALITCTQSDGITLGPGNVFTVAISAVKTAGLLVARAHYDLLVKLSGGDTVHLLGGTVFVTPSAVTPGVAL